MMSMKNRNLVFTRKMSSDLNKMSSGFKQTIIYSKSKITTLVSHSRMWLGVFTVNFERPLNLVKQKWKPMIIIQNQCINFGKGSQYINQREIDYGE